MTVYKFFSVAFLLLLISSCEDKKTIENNYSISTSAKKNALVKGGTVSISLKAKKEFKIDSVVYFLENKRLGSTSSIADYSTTLNHKTLGHKELKAKIHTENGTTTTSTEIVLLNDTAPKIYTYTIVNRFPHQIDAYTQGLEFVEDTLYESNGELGKSTLRKLEYTSGKVLNEYKMDDIYFGEGLTILNDRIVQLTWRGKIGFTYDRSTFKRIGSFSYNNSKEGWGLCNDGKVIYKSDGTSKIWILDKDTYAEQGYFEPTDHRGVKKKFNELEYINGKIYANTYQKPSIAIINPENGAIEGVIDLRDLPDEVQSGLDTQNEVLNGIAYKANEDRLFVTGKHWNTLFEIKLEEK